MISWIHHINVFHRHSCNRFMKTCEHVYIWCMGHSVYSSPPSTAYMRRWTGSALVQVMACRLVGAKPLSEPMLGLIVNSTIRNKLQLNSNRHTFCSFTKMHLKMSSAKRGPFLFRGRWVKALWHSIAVCRHETRWLSNKVMGCHLFGADPGGRLNKKDGLTRYGDSHVKNKTS